MKEDIRQSTPDKKAHVSSAHSVSIPSDGELTCSEGQVEDLLAEGETTESEEEGDASESLDLSPASSVVKKSPPKSKPSR